MSAVVDKKAAMGQLRELLLQGSTIYVLVRRVAKSGDACWADVYIAQGSQIVKLTGWILAAGVFGSYDIQGGLYIRYPRSEVVEHVRQMLGFKLWNDNQTLKASEL